MSIRITGRWSPQGKLRLRNVVPLLTAPVWLSDERLPDGDANSTYSFQFQATGQNSVRYSYAPGSTFLTGSTLSPAGVLSINVPYVTAGDIDIVIRATDSVNGLFTDKTFKIYYHGVTRTYFNQNVSSPTLQIQHEALSSVTRPGSAITDAKDAGFRTAATAHFYTGGVLYWEFRTDASMGTGHGFKIGLIAPSADSSIVTDSVDLGGSLKSFGWSPHDGRTYFTGFSPGTVTGFPAGEVAGATYHIAWNANTGKIWVGRNGVWNGGATPATISNGTATPVNSNASASFFGPARIAASFSPRTVTQTLRANFGRSVSAIANTMPGNFNWPSLEYGLRAKLRPTAGFAITGTQGNNFSYTGSTLNEHGTIISVEQLPKTGKYYWEITNQTANAVAFGAVRPVDTLLSGNTAGIAGIKTTAPYSGWGWASHNGWRFGMGVNGAAIPANSANGTTWGIAYDADAGKAWASTNGVWGESATVADVAAGNKPSFTGIPSGGWYAAASDNINNTTGGGLVSNGASVNFGQAAFKYAVPTGFQRGFGLAGPDVDY